MGRPALVLVTLLAAAPPAAAQEADRPSRRERIAAQIEDTVLSLSVRLALAADPRTLPLELDVSSQGGVVRIAGDVPEPARRTVAEVALGVPGVRAVHRVDEPAPLAAAAAGPLPTVEPTFHTVVPGDTLFTLAQRYGTTVEALRDLNGLATTTIVAGRRLRVR